MLSSGRKYLNSINVLPQLICTTRAYSINGLRKTDPVTNDCNNLVDISLYYEHSRNGIYLVSE